MYQVVGIVHDQAAYFSPTRAAFPTADSVFRIHGVAQQGGIADLYSKDWFLFDSSLVLPEYIIHFRYLSPVR